MAYGEKRRSISAIVPEKTAFSCGTYVKIFRVAGEISAVSPFAERTTLPQCGFTSPSSTRRNVVLPPPEGPTNAANSPGAMVRFTPEKTSPPFLYPNATSRNAISGASPLFAMAVAAAFSPDSSRGRLSTAMILPAETVAEITVGTKLIKEDMLEER